MLLKEWIEIDFKVFLYIVGDILGNVRGILLAAPSLASESARSLPRQLLCALI